MKKSWIRYSVLLSLLLLPAATCSNGPPETAEQVIARSVEAHGGNALTQWKTLKIKGRVVMNDGVDYNAAYLLLAEKPGRLRMEQDMTADRGRLYYEYFLNDGVAWSRRNLLPSQGNLKAMQRLLGQCDGIAYYARNANKLILKGEGTVEIRGKSGTVSEERKVVESIPAYVIEATIGEETTELYIDKKTFYLVQEKYGNQARIYSRFKKYGAVVLPSNVAEVTVTQRGERVLPITYETVEYDAPIEGWVFEEDMPPVKPPG